MHPDIAALLALQSDDAEIHRMQEKLAAMSPRLDALAREHARALAALDKAKQGMEAEERRKRDVTERLAQHRTLRERNQAQLEGIRSEREASAATAQLEQSDRMIDTDQREIESLDNQVRQMRDLVSERETVAHKIEEELEQTRNAMDADVKLIEAQLAALRAQRKAKAPAVPRSLLSTYDRIRVKHPEQAAFPLRNNSCSNCDTTVPMSRRSALHAGSTDICEGCGVLLYAAE